MMDFRYNDRIIEMMYADWVRAARAERERAERLVAEAEVKELNRWLRIERKQIEE